MEKSKTLLKVFNTIFPIIDQLYIFQLEEYSKRRYFKRIPQFLFRRNLQRRSTLVISTFIKRLVCTIIGIHIILSLLLITNIFLLSVTNILLLLFPQVSILLAGLILKPYYYIISENNKQAAKEKVSIMNNLRVIGITGSYGKTTSKELLNQLIKDTFITQMTPGNTNSAIGIANWVNQNLTENTQILTVEMGAYIRGEIKEICNITPPDIALITEMGDQHLERFGSMENLIKAKQEIYKYSKNNAIKYAPHHLSSFITEKGVTFVEIPLGIKTNLPNSRALTHNLSLVIQIAKDLGVKKEFIQHSLQNLSIPDRRGDRKEMVGFEVVDNSYNISLNTATEAVNSLKNENKKILVITAGIPEVGKNKKNYNLLYGKLLNKEADEILLLDSILSKYISPQIDEDKLTLCNNFQQALDTLRKRFDPKEYIVLLQPEFSDLYY